MMNNARIWKVESTIKMIQELWFGSMGLVAARRMNCIRERVEAEDQSVSRWLWQAKDLWRRWRGRVWYWAHCLKDSGKLGKEEPGCHEEEALCLGWWNYGMLVSRWNSGREIRDMLSVRGLRTSRWDLNMDNGEKLAGNMDLEFWREVRAGDVRFLALLVCDLTGAWEGHMWEWVNKSYWGSFDLGGLVWFCAKKRCK